MMGVGLTDEEADYVRGLHNGDTNQLRLLHYPPAMIAQDVGGDRARLGAHTDWRYGSLSFELWGKRLWLS